MAKGFKLGKGFFKGQGPTPGSGRLSKKVKGKGLAYSYNNRGFSLSLDIERDLAMDDMGSEDIGFDWGPRLAKAKATTLIQITSHGKKCRICCTILI